MTAATVEAQQDACQRLRDLIAYTNRVRRLAAENRLLKRIIADQREQIAHLLDQPLIILNGDAYIGVQDYRQPCPN